MYLNVLKFNQIKICIFFIFIFFGNTIKLIGQPQNDFCTNAIAVPLEAGTSCNLVNYAVSNATFSNNLRCQNEVTTNDVWYSITPSQNVLYGNLGIFTGQCHLSIYDACNSSPIFCRPFNISNPYFNLNVNPGTTYYIRISDFSFMNGNMEFDMCFWEDCNISVSIITNTSTICDGESALLEAFANFGTPPYSYQWDQNLSPDQYQTVSPNVNTNYNVTVTDINNCSDTGTITIIVNALPIVTAFANTPVCEGFGTILFGNGGTYYNWAGPNNFNSTQQNALVEGLPQNSGTYFLTVTENNGCSSTSSVNILINPAPTLILHKNNFSCQKDSLILTVSGANTYMWNGPNGFTSTLDTIVLHNVIPAQSGIYKVKGQGTNLCQKTDSIKVTIYPTYSYGDQVISCFNELSPGGQLMTATGFYIDSLTTVNSCDSIISTYFIYNATEAQVSIINDTIIQAIGDGTYQWFDCTLGQNIPNENSQIFIPTQNGNYAVIITNASGCVDTSVCVTIDVSSSQSIINPKSITVSPNPTSNIFYVYGLTQPANYEIYSLQGLKISNGSVFDQSIQILEKGIFYIKLMINNEIIVKKLIVL